MKSNKEEETPLRSLQTLNLKFINPSQIHPKSIQIHPQPQIPKISTNPHRNPPIQSNSSSLQSKASTSTSNPKPRPMNPKLVEASESRRNATAEAVDRLEEMMLVCSEGGEISQEQVQVNDPLQEDEVLALEAIYGDDVFNIDKKGGLRFLQVNVHVEVPRDFTVSANLDSSTENLKQIKQGGFERNNDSDDFLCTFKVKYLPPIVLTCLLPLSYPSHLSPYFTLYVQWLDDQKISSLCQMLDNIWIEQPRQEVLYRWVEWLHGSSLSFLGFDNELRLDRHDGLNIGDPRSISGNFSLEVEIPSLIGYNAERCEEAFLNDLHECAICYSEYAGRDFIKLPCHHFFCFKCMETYCNIHVKEGTVITLLCPDTNCGELIPPYLLRRLLASESYERWESLMLQKTLDSMPDIIYCPRCETACLEDDDGHHAQCTKCFFSFCSLCREHRHVGVECMSQDTKLQILKERQGWLDGDKRRKELNIINDILSFKEVIRDSKQCPTCKMAISRDGGCNKIVCKNCGKFFCYRCGKKISGYDHFKRDCPLFPPEEILNWEMDVDPQYVIGQMQIQF